jgi:hypothetical protein
MQHNGPLHPEQYTKPLTEWAKQTIEGRLWEKYDDLHIDVLNAQFREPGQWVEAGLFFLSCLQDIVDKSKYEILLTIPLASSGSPVESDTLHLDKLEELVDSTPPSFYLYPVDSLVFDKTIKASLYLPALSRSMNYAVYLKEEQEDGEYYRGLFVK